MVQTAKKIQNHKIKKITAQILALSLSLLVKYMYVYTGGQNKTLKGK